jgi:hypothetical protein
MLIRLNKEICIKTCMIFGIIILSKLLGLDLIQLLFLIQFQFLSIANLDSLFMD